MIGLQETWQSWLTVRSCSVSFISFTLTLFEPISVYWSIWPFSLMLNENFLVTKIQSYIRDEMSVQLSWVSVVYISLVQLLILSQHSGWWQAASAGQGRHAGLSRSPLSVRDSDRSHLTPRHILALSDPTTKTRHYSYSLMDLEG